MAYNPKDKNPSGIVLFGNNGSDQVFESVTDFVYDTGNKRFGIGTTSPAYQVEIENSGANALLVLDRTDGAACFIEGQATRSAFGSVGATPLALAYNSFAVVLIGENGAITVNPDGDGFTFPNTDGSANQVLQTDGSGTVSWASTVETFNGSTGAVQGVSSVNGNTGGITAASGIRFAYTTNTSPSTGELTVTASFVIISETSAGGIGMTGAFQHFVDVGGGQLVITSLDGDRVFYAVDVTSASDVGTSWRIGRSGKDKIDTANFISGEQVSLMFHPNPESYVTSVNGATGDVVISAGGTDLSVVWFLGG